jgi:hypothetical protein
VVVVGAYSTVQYCTVVVSRERERLVVVPKAANTRDCSSMSGGGGGGTSSDNDDGGLISRRANRVLEKVFGSCADDPKGSVHRAWGISLIFVLVYFILSIFESEFCFRLYMAGSVVGTRAISEGRGKDTRTNDESFISTLCRARSVSRNSRFVRSLIFRTQ